MLPWATVSIVDSDDTTFLVELIVIEFRVLPEHVHACSELTRAAHKLSKVSNLLL